MVLQLNAEKALIFRITHIKNVQWLLAHGLHCRSAGQVDPAFVSIGNADLIEKRATRRVGVPPGGVLADYIPFYFTPWSIMLYKILTGHQGTPMVPRSDIVIVVASLRELTAAGHVALFTDQHAYPQTARYFNNLEMLAEIDWDLLVRKDFKHNPEDPGKTVRYHAEALVHRFLPTDALKGIVCFGENEKRTVEALREAAGVDLTIARRPEWFFI